MKELLPLDADAMGVRYESTPWGWLHFEQVIYTLAGRFCDDYNGGYWRFYPVTFDATKELGAVLNVPMLDLDDDDETFHITHNYVDEVVNTQTFCACVTSYAMTYAAEKLTGEAMHVMYRYRDDFNAAIKRGAVEGVDTKVFHAMID